MRILVLDDMLDRHKQFYTLHKSNKHIVIHTYRYEDCIMELKSTPDSFDLIFLDHDLSTSSIMCDPDECTEKTGSDVAKWIASNLDTKTCGKIVCHSLNPAGRRNMVGILDKAGFSVLSIPFIYISRFINTL